MTKQRMDFDRAAYIYQCAVANGGWEGDIPDLENSEKLSDGGWLLKDSQDNPIAIITATGNIQTEFIGGQKQQPRHRPV